jgi:two-component system cell cycle response regulator DivK
MSTILVVDDRPSSRELLRTVLDNAGYEVIEAADGAEALEKAHKRKPDLILLDLQLPGLDGFGVIGALRSEPRFSATPIVAITASAMQGDREKALQSGFTSYITKPVRLAVLRAEIERLLR